MTALDQVSISELRGSLGPAFSEVIQQHKPLFIERNGRDHGLLLGQDEVLRLLESHAFHPEVFREGEVTSIWLPEFAIYGRGGSFAAAVEDLLDEVRDYVLEFLADSESHLRAPNRAHHFPLVLKAALAELRGELQETLLAEPPEPAAA